jgi:hypothetical protein
VTRAYPAYQDSQAQRGRAHGKGEPEGCRPDLLGGVCRRIEPRERAASQGLKRGAHVAIYVALIPEATISMLASARIGTIHSVMFSGFSPESLRDALTT